MNQINTKHALDNARRIGNEDERRPRSVYRTLIGKLADGDYLDEHDTRQLAESMKMLNVYDKHVQIHVDALKQHRNLSDQLADAEKAVLDHPNSSELYENYHKLETELAKKIDTMLDGKRELEDKIIARRKADTRVADLRRTKQATDSEHPELFL